MAVTIASVVDAFLRLSRRLERRVSATALIVIAGAVFVTSVVGVASAKKNDSASPVTVERTTTTVPVAAAPTSQPPRVRTPITGFDTASFELTKPGSPTASYCGLLASTPDQLARGVMGLRDLGGYDGMIFTFAADSSAAFYMANVLAPVSVAWFDGSGTFVSAMDTTPCTVEAAKCPLYQATGPYRVALETFTGQGSLQVGPGSMLTVGAAGSCA